MQSCLSDSLHDLILNWVIFTVLLRSLVRLYLLSCVVRVDQSRPWWGVDVLSSYHVVVKLLLESFNCEHIHFEPSSSFIL
jgi:hypothetical protein